MMCFSLLPFPGNQDNISLKVPPIWAQVLREQAMATIGFCWPNKKLNNRGLSKSDPPVYIA